MSTYFHGYTTTEFQRLQEQAEFLAPEIYPGLHLPQHGQLLEIGCGVGAQTRILSRLYPNVSICSLDRNAEEIARAGDWLERHPQLKDTIRFVCSEFENWQTETPFDAAFICWVLEHVPDPGALLKHAALQLRSGASIHITEVQNNSLFVYPRNAAFEKYWQVYNQRQLDLEGNPFVGARMRHWLKDAGFESIEVQAHLMLRDQTQPEALKAMLVYWWNLIESTGDALVEEGYLLANERAQARDAIFALQSHPEACFFYTFVQAEATRI